MRPRIQFRHEAPWMRLCARAVLAGWLLPLLFALITSLGVGVRPAQAQDATGQTVVVLDFATPNGTDPLLGRKAADALAVELQRTGEYTVVTRQRLLEVVGQQAGLQPPFNDTAQVRLAQALGATSVFSGEVAAVDVVPGQSARARIVVRQLDAGTGDYINGTQNIESTEQKLTTVANEILVDEAINKSAFSAVRSMRQISLPSGNVLNTTRDEAELSLGTRNGVAVGQRYSVLRDVFNAARNVTERVKVGEVTIKRVEANQSTAALSAGGASGVRTGDRVRQIFTLAQAPVSLSANGNSSNPVTAPPSTRSGSTGIAKSKGAKGLFGLLALAGLVALAGLGGGGNSSTPNTNEPYEANPLGITPTATFTFTSGFSGFDKSLQNETVVGYLVYRGTSANFTPAIQNLQSFLDARTVSGGQRISYTDPLITSAVSLRQKVVVTATDSDTDGTAAAVSVNFTNADVDGTDNQNIEPQTATLEYTQRPLEIGTTYYYKVGRITIVRTVNSTDNTTTLTLAQSGTSTTTGGYTPLLRPLIVAASPDETTGIAYNLSNFSVRLNAQPDIDQLSTNGNYTFRINSNVATGVDIFRIQVSTSPSFSDATTFTSADTAPTTPNGTGDVVLNFGQIQIPNTTLGQFTNGNVPVYIRAQSRRSTDAVEVFRVSPTVTVPANQVTDSPDTTSAILASRFLRSTADQSGIRIGRRGTRGTSGVAVPRTRVGKPRG
ncbi:hypothetical protein IAD21_05131 [Abditibacteriota bacterium]|nr:hypothetical protein IAD21_05131 [Abditibacteriota bacterium]